MPRINKANQEEIREKIREGRIEGAVLGRDFIDTIIKKMKERGVGLLRACLISLQNA